MKHEITLEEIIKFLLHCEIFKYFNEIELADIIKILYPKWLKKGEAVFIEGNHGNAIYIVYKGKLKVLKKFFNGESHEIGELLPYHVFGEMAILDGMKRSATVVAVEDTICFEIRKKDFDELIEIDNVTALKLTYHIAKFMSLRIRKNEERIVKILSKCSESSESIKGFLENFIHTLKEDLSCG